MTTAYATLITGLAGRIQDQANKLGRPDRDLAILRARDIFSDGTPRVLYKDYTGDGTAYAFDLPNDTGKVWEDGFSAVVSLECPAGEREPAFLEDNAWSVRQWTATTQKLVLKGQTPGQGQTLRLGYTVRHTVDTTAVTIPDPYVEAFLDLAGAIACELLAAIYTQTGDSTINADVVNYRSKAQEYRDLAKGYQDRYDDWMNSDGPTTPEVSRSPYVDWDSKAQAGIDYLYHNRRGR